MEKRKQRDPAMLLFSVSTSALKLNEKVILKKTLGTGWSWTTRASEPLLNYLYCARDGRKKNNLLKFQCRNRKMEIKATTWPAQKYIFK